MSSYYISLIFNFLLIISFIVDRVFRIRSIKEYRDARDAEVAVLKARIDFVEKFNDDFISEKYKKSVENLKLLIIDRDLEIENTKKSLESIKLLQEESQREPTSNKNYEEILAQKEMLEEAIDRLQREKEGISREIQGVLTDLQNKNKKLSEYSSHLSHQIRGPIATLKGVLNLQKEGVISSEECMTMMHKCVADIDQNIIDMTVLLHDNNA